MSDVVVREIEAGEIAGLGALTAAAYAALSGAPLGDDYLAELGDVAPRARDACVLVAVDGRGTLLGGVTYVDDPSNPFAEFDDADAAGIRMLAVGLEAQRRGVGEALVVACIERARSAGKARVVLHSTQSMPTARRLYDRLGFDRDPAHDWTPEPGVDLIAYQLDLGRTL